MTPTGPLLRLRRSLATAAFVALVVVWLGLLRPEFLGGPTGYILVAGTSMEPALHTGDLVVTTRRRTYGVGEVVAYRIPAGQAGAGRVVIHRITGGSAAHGYIMRGDNRDADDLWRPTPADIVGAQQVRLPALGRVARAILTPVGLGLLAGLAAIVLIAGPRERERRPRVRRRRRLERRWMAMVATSGEQQRPRHRPDADHPRPGVDAGGRRDPADADRLATAGLGAADAPAPSQILERVQAEAVRTPSRASSA